MKKQNQTEPRKRPSANLKVKMERDQSRIGSAPQGEDDLGSNPSDKDWSLSDNQGEAWPGGEHWYLESDVREFIRRLKKSIRVNMNWHTKYKNKVCDKIDKLAGEKLI